MTVLVLAEHDNHQVKPCTLATLGAASYLKAPIHILVIAKDAHPVVESLKRYEFVEKIWHATYSSDEHAIAEEIVEIMLPLVNEYSHVLAPSTTYGKNILPRVAGCMDLGMISDVTAIIDHNTFQRPIYAGNAIATVQSEDPCIFMTVRPTHFENVKESTSKAIVERIEQEPINRSVKFMSLNTLETERPSLDAARVVISGGRGLQSKENFQLIEKLAEKLNAAIGASRAAVDAGFVPNDYQVGQTGKIVAPDLYIAIGISGAIQHLAGMKDSKIIVAINKDEEAPIFQVADYGIVGDLFKIVPELIEAL